MVVLKTTASSQVGEHQKNRRPSRPQQEVLDLPQPCSHFIWEILLEQPVFAERERGNQRHTAILVNLYNVLPYSIMRHLPILDGLSENKCGYIITQSTLKALYALT